MKKRTRIILITILIITGITYIPTLTVPWVQGKRIEPGRTYLTTHSKNRGYYRLHVEKGQYYALSIHWDQNVYPTIEIYSTVLKLYGIYRYSSGANEIYVKFQAKSNGFEYITVDSSKDGTFRLLLEKITDGVVYLINYHKEVNFRRVTLYSLSAILCVLIVLLPPFFRFVKKKYEEFEYDPKQTCPDCGVKLRKSIGYCKSCGHTFVPPKTNKY